MGKTGVPFHPMTQFHAANAGEVQIKEDDIGLQRERFLVSFFTVIHPVAAPAFCRQKFLHQLPESDVVINHQKSSFHGLISSRPVYPEPVTRVLWSCKSLVRVVNPAKADPPHFRRARPPEVWRTGIHHYGSPPSTRLGGRTGRMACAITASGMTHYKLCLKI